MIKLYPLVKITILFIAGLVLAKYIPFLNKNAFEIGGISLALTLTFYLLGRNLPRRAIRYLFLFWLGLSIISAGIPCQSSYPPNTQKLRLFWSCRYFLRVPTGDNLTPKCDSISAITFRRSVSSNFGFAILRASLAPYFKKKNLSYSQTKSEHIHYPKFFPALRTQIVYILNPKILKKDNWQVLLGGLIIKYPLLQIL